MERRIPTVERQHCLTMRIVKMQKRITPMIMMMTMRKKRVKLTRVTRRQEVPRKTNLPCQRNM
eukprot:scaffold20793_cov46-Skeletonema_menzelii.AAC.1